MNRLSVDALVGNAVQSLPSCGHVLYRTWLLHASLYGIFGRFVIKIHETAAYTSVRSSSRFCSCKAKHPDWLCCVSCPSAIGCKEKERRDAVKFHNKGVDNPEADKNHNNEWKRATSAILSFYSYLLSFQFSLTG